MTKHFGAVEADFLSHYGLDLRSSLWGEAKIGARRLISLIRGLPPRGAVTREIATKGADWGMQEELLATLIEVVDLSNRMFMQANAAKGSVTPKAIRIPRPTDRKDSHDHDGYRKQTPVKELKEAFAGSTKFVGSSN